MHLPMEYIDLPMQATLCRIAGLQPVEDGDPPFFKDTKWTVKAMRSFYDLAANKRLLAQVVVSDFKKHYSIILFSFLRCSTYWTPV